MPEEKKKSKSLFRKTILYSLLLTLQLKTKVLCAMVLETFE